MNKILNYQSINRKNILITLAVLSAAVILSMFFVLQAWAHEDPVDCNASAIQQIPTVSPGGSVYDGSILTYTVTYSNIGAGACNVTLADATIVLPNSSVINVLADATLNVGDSISCPGGPGCATGPYTYAVNHANEAGGSVTATFDIAGVLHQDENEEAANDHDTLSKTVIHPSTVTSISSSSATVAAGGSVTFTVTEQNNGDVALTNPSVIVDNGVGTLAAPPTSGDTGGDGILGVGETWSWTVNSGVINANTTFTATGHGFSNGNDITWCENPQSPPQGVICDQEERDTVDVTIVNPLVIEKTAQTSFDRDWDWTIVKSADQTDLELQEGESFTVNYDVTVNASSEDVNHMVSGTVTITNPVGNPDVQVTSVTDALNSSGGATLNCDQTIPAVLSSGESINCTYNESVPNKNDNENEVTVTTDGTVPGGSDTATVVWGDPSNVIDECIDVSDINDTDTVLPDTICANETLPHTYEYGLTFGPEGGEGVEVVVACGEMDHPNIASFITTDDSNDTDESGSDDWNVHVTVNCFEGCTLTQGYWKTHSQEGPAPYDSNWQNLPGGLQEDTLFFNSGKTWYELFTMPPKGGNAYIQLAHQYMAAKLNILTGASTTSAVDLAITGAEALFNAQGAGDMTLSKSETTTARDYAGTLGSYNEGTIGPGHCDEQNPQ